MMDAPKALEQIDRDKVSRRSAEIILTLLDIYRNAPRGELRNVICAVMNEQAALIADLRSYLEGERPSPRLRDLLQEEYDRFTRNNPTAVDL